MEQYSDDVLTFAASKFAEALSIMFTQFVSYMQYVMPVVAAALVAFMAVSFFNEVARDITAEVERAVDDMLSMLSF